MLLLYSKDCGECERKYIVATSFPQQKFPEKHFIVFTHCVKVSVDKSHKQIRGATTKSKDEAGSTQHTH